MDLAFSVTDKDDLPCGTPVKEFTFAAALIAFRHRVGSEYSQREANTSLFTTSSSKGVSIYPDFTIEQKRTIYPPPIEIYSCFSSESWVLDWGIQKGFPHVGARSVDVVGVICILHL